MKVTPIRDPAPGEQVVGVDPPLAPETDAGWRRRLSLVPSRALDAEALTAEQDGRAGRLATRGQALSPGVVGGLEVLLENDPVEGPVLRIRAGTGLMPTGEDVTVLTDLRVALKEVRVHGTRVSEKDESMLRFEQWADPADLTAPRAAILVLEPAELEVLQTPRSAEDPGADPCEEDPSAYPFENWERRDACRPLLYVWPNTWQPLPPRDATWRNQIAYTVFRQEGRKGPEEALPWEGVGVPVALIGFDDAWAPLFVDRHSVARAGGKPKRRTDALPGTGNPFLWQARFDQLLEELADADAQHAPIGDVVARFRYLPPAGLLPRSAFAPEMAHQWFFPSSYVIDAAPVPIEHLDVALEASASLGRYDLFTPDQVRLLVPVPRKFWEPRLLHGEDVDPRFERAIAEAVARRSDWLRRRESVRRKAAALIQALTGLAPAYPSPDADPGRLDPEEESPVYPVPIAGRAHWSGSGAGTHTHGFTGAPGPPPAGSEPAPGAEPFTMTGDDRFVVWVFLDPANPPRELMLTWLGVGSDGTEREQRAYWGAKLAAAATPVPPLLVGALPPPGRWVRLEVDAVAAGLADVTLTGVEFTATDGRATWARAGVSPLEQPSPAEERVWVGDDFPEGASAIAPDATHEAWVWLDRPPATPDTEPEYGTALNGLWPIRVATGVERLVEEVKGRFIGWDELSLVYSHGLERFVETLEAAIDQANDQINFGYLRVQTAMYRLRQSVLGDKVADRLVTSPVLAQIARESQGAAQISRSLTEVFTSFRDTEATARPKRWWGRELEIQVPPGMGGVDEGPLLSSKLIVSSTSKTTTRTALEAESTKEAAPSTGINPINLLSGALGGTLIESATFFAPKVTELAGVVVGGATASPGATAAPSPSDVEEARPVAGKAIRTTSIAERILDSRAVEAKDSCAATKRDVIKGLLTLVMEVDDLDVLGLPLTDAWPDFGTIAAADIGPEELPDPPPASPPRFRGTAGPLGVELMLATGMPAREPTPRTLDEFRGPPGAVLLNWITGEADPLDPSDTEAGYFAVGSDLLNHTTALLRGAEGRVAEYRDVVARARRAIDEVTAVALESDRRLKVIEDELAEARHDVATARALLEDERRRVRAINERREAILREHVTFVAYHRPRFTDLLLDAPVRPLDPGPTPSPVPECLTHDEPVPPEVRSYLDLLRDAPASWFVDVPRLLNRFDRLPALHAFLAQAKARSAREPAVREGAPTAGLTILGRALDDVRRAQAEVTGAFRRQRQAVDLAPLARESWATLRAVAPAIVGLADLMDGEHGRSDVARLATEELDRIARVAGCLYRLFSQVLPALRLEWAERFSQYDRPASLRSLAVLPRWGTVDVLDRREMQALVDWLFSRIKPEQAEAVSLMNDLVRTCLLVASHSPVNQILAGHVLHDTPVQTGGRVRLAAPPGVRVGMQALLYRGDAVVARAVVEDLSAGVAAARFIQAERPETLSAGARVQFAAAAPWRGR